MGVCGRHIGVVGVAWIIMIMVFVGRAWGGSGGGQLFPVLWKVQEQGTSYQGEHEQWLWRSLSLVQYGIWMGLIMVMELLIFCCRWKTSIGSMIWGFKQNSN